MNFYVHVGRKEREREAFMRANKRVFVCQEEVGLSFIPFRHSTSRVQFVTVVSLFAYLAVTRPRIRKFISSRILNTEFDHRSAASVRLILAFAKI